MMERSAFYVLSLCALMATSGAFHVWQVPVAVGNAYVLSWAWRYDHAA